MTRERPGVSRRRPDEQHRRAAGAAAVADGDPAGPLVGRGWRERAVSLVSGVVLLGLAALLVAATYDGTILVLRPGGWAPRWGSCGWSTR
jgi:hypothetical protein